MTANGRTSHPKTQPELTYEQAMALYVVSDIDSKLYTVRECPDSDFSISIRKAVLTSPAATVLCRDLELVQWNNPVDRWWILCRLVEHGIEPPCTVDCSTLLARYAEVRRKKVAV